MFKKKKKFFTECTASFLQFLVIHIISILNLCNVNKREKKNKSIRKLTKLALSENRPFMSVECNTPRAKCNSKDPSRI